jgi:hypothetical protein
LKKILGIVLVRDEDRFVRQAVRNAWEFCDRILLVDHRSEDATAGILREFAAEPSGKASFHAIARPHESHALLKPFVGTETWVFGVDGDEIYDPRGLQAFRPRLLAGEYDSHWMILGNVLHCDRVGARDNLASGFPAPPSRSITKLYNFAAIDSWEGDTPERLHGGCPAFRPGFHEGEKRRLQLEYSWEESPLRCLHACFVPRSSLDEAGTTRENIMETFCGGWTNRIKRLARRLAGIPKTSDWKRERYARGERLTVPAAPFFA